MRPSAAQVDRVAEALVRRLIGTQVLEPTVGENVLRARVATIFNKNFDEEAEIEREAMAEAAQLVRRGAPTVSYTHLTLPTTERV